MVATEPTTISVAPGSELARLLDEAAGKPLVLVKGGVRYRLEREGDVTTGACHAAPPETEPDTLQAGIEAAAGSWHDLDTERMIADIYRWREEGSRSAQRS